MSFRPYLRRMKRLVNGGIERLWGVGFAVFGRLRRSGPPRWSSPGGRQVLVVAPHPDDEAIGCVGTIFLHLQAGDRICIVIATDGRRSRAIPDPDRMAAQRQQEAQLAASRMGVDTLAWLGFPEGDCSQASLEQALRRVLLEVQPDTIYAPSRIDFHPEHMKVAHALARALAPDAAICGAKQRKIGAHRTHLPDTGSPDFIHLQSGHRRLLRRVSV